MSDPNREVGYHIGDSLWLTKAANQKNKCSSKDKLLGIELPFDWCLVRGSELRKLQSDLRQAKFDAVMRLHSCANLLKEQIRKELLC